MYMKSGFSSVKAKHIIIALLAVLIWEFSFPHTVVAEIQQNKNNTYDSLAFPLLQQHEVRLPDIPDKPQPEAKQSMRIAVTAYSSTADQTCGDPFITASGSTVREGVIAANFLPIGSKVRFPEYFGNKIFTVEDRMSSRYWHRADIWMPSREQAIEWGVRYATIEIL